MYAKHDTPHWFLSALARLDRLAPGLLSETIETGAPRRQTIAAACALLNDEAFQSADVAQAIKTMKKGRLFRALRISVPGAFAQLVANPRFGILDRELYRFLVHWLEGDPGENVIHALRHGPKLSVGILAVADSLDPLALSPRALEVVPDIASAHGINKQIKLVRRLVDDLKEQELRTTIDAFMRDAHEFLKAVLNGDDYLEEPQSLIQRFLDRCRFPEAPLEPQPRLWPLRNAEDMRRAGSQLRNCAGELVDAVALDDCYFYVWHPEAGGPPKALVRLRRTGLLWRHEEHRAARNAELSDSEQLLMLQDLESAGAVDGEDWPPTPWVGLCRYNMDEFRKDWLVATNKVEKCYV